MPSPSISNGLKLVSIGLVSFSATVTDTSQLIPLAVPTAVVIAGISLCIVG